MVSLHVKYRPKKFEDVVGQNSIVKSIQSMIKKGSVHTFLFDGPSGCGKTTLARICAREVGCDPEYVLDIDAATNTGVENIRAVQEVLRYKPLGDGKVRVVILDECHMLSKSAWNSMLKVVEEPPEHIYWFFCTTELGKVPATIKTRCAKASLKALSFDDLKILLQRVLKKEKATMDKKILDVVIGEAYGSPRKALVNLESCLEATSVREASEILQSAVASDSTIELCRFLVKGGGSWGAAMKIVEKLKDVESESVRIVLCNYVAAVLKKVKSTRDAGRHLAILEAFEGPYHQSEKQAPLLLSLGRVLLQ